MPWKNDAGIARLRQVRKAAALEVEASNRHRHFRSKVHRFIRGMVFPHPLSYTSWDPLTHRQDPRQPGCL